MIRVYFFEMAILYCYMLDPAVDQTSLDLPTTHRLILNISIWNLNKWNILSHSWVHRMSWPCLTGATWLDVRTENPGVAPAISVANWHVGGSEPRFWHALTWVCAFFFFSESAGHPNLCLTFVPFRSEANPAEAQSHGRGFWFLWYGYGPKMKTIHFSVSIMWPCQGNLSLELVQSQQPVGYVQFFSYLKDCRSCS